MAQAFVAASGACGQFLWFSGWTDRPDVSLIGVPGNPRVMDRLNITWATRMKTLKASDTSEKLRRNVWCDISQNPHRGTMSGSPGTLCVGSMPYSFEKDCTLDGEDALALQGFPIFFLPAQSLTTPKRESSPAKDITSHPSPWSVQLFTSTRSRGGGRVPLDV